MWHVSSARCALPSWPVLASVAPSAPLAQPPPARPARRRLLRSAVFWTRALRIWGGYKAAAARIALLSRTRGPDWAARAWDAHHARAGDDMWALCSDLKAFYAKVGQLVAMQAFVPPVIRKKLSALQSDMPLLPSEELREILARALPRGKTVASTFARVDLDSALGSASIASVHYAELADSQRTKVAVKIQLPTAESLMAGDLGNLRLLASVLQKTDLKFDLVRPVDELRAQIAAEFDFVGEAEAMQRIHQLLRSRRVRGVRVPLPIPGLVSKQLLVMEYMDGLPLARVEAKAGRRALRRLGKTIMRHLGDAYGVMILQEGFFQADPHPGNVLVLNRNMDIALIDYGQTKGMNEDNRLAFAGLVDAMARRSPKDVAASMEALGIAIEDVESKNAEGKKEQFLLNAKARAGASAAPITALSDRDLANGLIVGPARAESSDYDSLTENCAVRPQKDQSRTLMMSASQPSSRLTSAEKLAYTMFDTAEYEGVSSDPFSNQSALRSTTVSNLPKELFFLLRTVQIMRGICAATGNSDYSIARVWAPIARTVLKEGRKR